MSLTIQQIINEADIRVPNAFSTANKVDWLNQVNQEFFDVVKIPAISTVSVTSGISGYPLSAGVRAKNINRVTVGNVYYRNIMFEQVNPGNNYWTFDDTTNQINLYPTPNSSGNGVVRYNKINTTTFLSTDLTKTPDAPDEYHWIYILGLCERIAKSMNDTILGNNYANDYKANLLIAQQNYAKKD